MKTIKMHASVGSFAENKDTARELRQTEIIPLLAKEKTVVLDFARVESTTQSFVHALISDLIRKQGSEVLDRIYFKNCNSIVQKIITIVVDYMQETES